ncbi:MAG: tetratricopeptide repeat protein [Elusimicrobia bacterium]|nr:tetratricopeptide repeat protein [Elusimicrobiota bacterium]
MNKIFAFAIVAAFSVIYFASISFALEREPLRSEELSLKLQKTSKEKVKLAILVELADEYRLEENFDKAFLTCNEALNLDPDRKKKQKIFRIIGDIYFAKKDFSHAINYYQDAVALAPEHEGVRLSLAKAYEESDLYELAIQEYLKILKMNQKSFEANFSLGNLYLREGFPDKALRYYRRALSIRIDARVYRNLAVCYESSGEINLAISVIKSAAAINTVYEDYIDLGRLYSAKKKYKEAEESFVKALDLNKNIIDGYVYLGLLYIENNDIEAAKNTFISACEGFPDNALAHFFLGNIYFKEKLVSFAKKEIEKSSKLAKDDILKKYSQRYLEFINKTIR